MDHWYVPRHVALHEVGPDCALRLDALADWLQGAAAEHAGALGLSTEGLLAQGLGWSLTRMTAHITALPQMDRTIHIETWPAARDKRFFYRDYIVRNERNETLVTATSRWGLFDIKARTAVPVPDDMAVMVIADPTRADEFSSKAFPALASDAACFERAVLPRWSDVDVNGHVNNARLASWILEGLPRDIPAERKLKTVDISFRSECPLDTAVVSRSQSDEDGLFRHAVVNGDTGKDIARAVTVWA